nr:putative ribonuclease H-like domain-containing protein [Tanacetum cinerariifolium]
MTLEVHNWSSSAHKEVHRIISHEITPIINQVDARVQKFEIQFLQEAVKFVRDFKSLTNEADESLYKNVIAPGMFKINQSQMPRVDLLPNKQSSASIRTNPITNSQRHVILKENVSSNMATTSSTGLVHTARTRRPQPKGNTRNARVPSASKSSEVKKSVTVEDHHRTLLLSKNRKTIPSECNNIKLAIRNDKSKIVCDTCKQCLVTANHDACLTPFMNVLNPRANKLFANVPLSANQKRHRTQVWKPKQVGSKERLASKPRLPRLSLKWNDHIAAILGYGDLKWGNITITRVYFVEGLGHNLFSQGKSKRASHPPKPIPNSKQRLHLLHMDLCGPMQVASINGKRYVLVIVDDYSRYTWVHFLKTKDETPEVIKNLLKKIYVRLQALVIIVRTDNGTEFKNQVLKEYFDSVGITHENSAAKSPQQNRVVERTNRTLVEAAITIPSERDLDILFKPLHNEYLGGRPAEGIVWVKASAESMVRRAVYISSPEQILQRLTNPPVIGTPVDARKYHSMIGALMYLTSSRPDIVHTTCVCARYQAHPTEKHLKEVKRIFRYLWGTVNMVYEGFWF